MAVTGIYFIKNEETKAVYIGQAINIPARWNDHLHDLLSNKHVNPHLQYAFNKYGYGKFYFQIWTTCEVDELDYIEKLAIWVCKRQGIELYNIQDGGNGTQKSEETKKKMSESAKGRTFSPETRAMISASLKEYHKTNENAFKGKAHTEETRQRMSESKTGKPWTEAQYKARGLS